MGWETKPSFAVGQNNDRAEVLYLMQNMFMCGFIRRDFSDKTLKYEVRSLDDLCTKIIPHFEKYALLSGKRNDFLLFKKICLRMKKGEHKTSRGLKHIVRTAYNMNASGKRKYSQREILRTIR